MFSKKIFLFGVRMVLYTLSPSQKFPLVVFAFTLDGTKKFPGTAVNVRFRMEVKWLFFSRLLRTVEQCKWMFISVDLNKWHPSDILNALMAAHTSSGDLLGVVKSEPRAKGWQMRSQAGSEAKCREAKRKSWKFTSSVSIRAILMPFYD